MKGKALTILLAAASLAVGCSKENGSKGDNPTGAFTVNATQPTTRTALDDSNVLTWTATDQIGLVKAGGSTNVQFTTKAEDITNDGKNAKFTGNALAAGDYYAYYPYNTRVSSSVSPIALTGQIQDGIRKDHVGAYDVMVSDKVTLSGNQTEANFTFHHIGALHQFGVYLKAAEAGVKVIGLTFRAHDASNNPVNAFATGLYFDPASGEMIVSASSNSAILSVSNSPDLGVDPSKPFVMNLMMYNKAASYPYTIDVVVRTNKGAIILTDVKTIASAADEFQPGKRYTKTVALDMSTVQFEIPDANFRNNLGALGFTFSGTGIDLSNPANVALLASTTQIDCKSLNITSLEGIEYFPNLDSLECTSNKLKSLDVSQNTALTKLVCQGNQLATLDVSKNTNLDTLWCNGNQLTSLDVSKNTKLTFLWCFVNQLTALDVSKNTALKELRLFSNQLTALDVSKNTALTGLVLGRNSLTAIDVSRNTLLTTLDCSNNQLTALDVSKNTALTYLSCEKNKLAEVDITPLSLLATVEAGQQTSGTITLYLTAAQQVKWDATWKSKATNANVSPVVK